MKVAGSYSPSSSQMSRVAQGTELEQPLPVGIVARQPRDLEAEHDARPAHADVRHQALEPFTPGSRAPRAAEIVVDDHDLVVRPAEDDRSLAQAVLTLGGRRVLHHLPESALPHVQVGGATEMSSGHLGSGGVAGDHSPPPITAKCHAGENLHRLCRGGRGEPPGWLWRLRPGSSSRPRLRPRHHAGALDHRPSEPRTARLPRRTAVRSAS